MLIVLVLAVSNCQDDILGVYNTYVVEERVWFYLFIILYYKMYFAE